MNVSLAVRSGLAFAIATLASGGALAAPAKSTPDSPDTPRFAVTATIATAPPGSADGRYQLSASAKLATDDAQRYQVKALAADCSHSVPDPVFKDGFE